MKLIKRLVSYEEHCQAYCTRFTIAPHLFESKDDEQDAPLDDHLAMDTVKWLRCGPHAKISG